MVVQKYIEKGLPIKYNRNEENIGADRNFLKCIQWASGKYIYLLGDDDILKPGMLKYLLDLLRGKEYGAIHIFQRPAFDLVFPALNTRDEIIKTE